CHYSTNQKDRLNHFFITSQIICIIAFFTYKNILIQFYNRFRIKSICSSLTDPMIHLAIHQFVKNNWTYYFEIRFSIRSEEHTSELQSRFDLVCRLLLEKKKYI